MRVDLLVPWPRNNDYPLWRAWLRRERSRFGMVIVAFTPIDGHDYRDFVVERMAPDDVTFLSHDPCETDWRQVATLAMLGKATAPWVWFTEQDFFPEPCLWPVVEALYEYGAEMIGTRQDQRWHPCCLFTRRDWISHQTEEYFGPLPVDHFYKFGLQLEEATWCCGNQQGPAELSPELFTHLAGTSSNMDLIERERFAEVYKPDQMAAYLIESLRDPVEPHARWRLYAQKFLDWYASGRG